MSSSLYLRLEMYLRRFRLHSTWVLGIPSLAAFLLYLPSLQGGLVWDDSLFLDHPLYRDPAYWLQALSSPFLLSPNYFRPLGIVTFLIEGLLGGSPWLHHLVNASLHALNTALVTLLAARLTGVNGESSPSRFAVLAAGLLYGLHPALVEGVAFISSRFDLLVTTFLLLALLVDHDLQGHDWLQPAAVGFTVFLAALSKEMAIAIVAVFPLWHLSDWSVCASKPAESSEAITMAWPPHRARLAAYLSYLRQRSAFSVYLAIGVGLAAYLVIRYGALGYLYILTSGHELNVGALWQHVLLVGRSLAEYTLLVLWPFNTLRPIHFSKFPLLASDITVWLALVGSIALLAGLAWWIRRDLPTGLLGATAVAALLPVLNVLPLELGGGAFAAERFLLFPLALLALAIGQLLSRGTGQGAQYLIGFWLVASLAVVQLTVPNWRSDQSLWEWGLRRAPGSPTPYINLALIAIDQGQPARGLALADQALALDSNTGNAYNQRGLALIHLGQYADAETAFSRAIEIEPQNALYWSNLAAALREQDHLDQAEQVLLNEAIPRDPMLGMAHFNLGLVYLKADRPDLATPALKRAVELLPPQQASDVLPFLDQARDPVRWLRLGDFFITQADPQHALEAFSQAEKLGAPTVDLAVGRSTALIALDDLEQAEMLLRAITLNAPMDARPYNNLGLIAQARGQGEEAREFFTRAAELAPEWAIPQQNLEKLEP